MRIKNRVMLAIALCGMSVWNVSHAEEEELFQEIQVTRNGTEQTILAHASGLTLYTFDLDQAGSGNSACYGTCAEKWPPYLLSEEEAKDLPEGFGVITRTNGLLHVTHNGLPLYLFYLDREATDFYGDGLGDVWHVVQLR